MDDFLFSVITPVHRFNPNFLKKLGESLVEFLDLLPTNSDPSCQWLICVDNESLDLSVISSITSKFEPKISVVIIPKDPSSISTPGSARNRGLRMARSTWLLTLDEDDFIDPHGFLQLFTSVRTNPDLFWAAGKAFDVDPSGSYLSEGPSSDISPGANFKGFFYAYRVSKGCPPFHPSATIVRTDVVKRLGGWPSSWDRTEDSALWCLVDLFYQGVWIPENVLAYRKHPDSVTSQPSYKRDTTDLMVKIAEFIMSGTTNPDSAA